MKTTGTAVYQRQHKRGLTMPQLNAIDLLAGGKTDKETAELLNLSRTCVTKWRLYDPVFQAALNHRRGEVWAAGTDRLRSLIPKALDTLAEVLEGGNASGRIKAAVAILALSLCPPTPCQQGRRTRKTSSAKSLRSGAERHAARLMTSATRGRGFRLSTVKWPTPGKN